MQIYAAMKNNNKKSCIVNIVCIVLPLIIGGLIYVFSDNSSFIRLMFSKLILYSFPKSELSNFCRNYLCDMLWGFSLMSAVDLVNIGLKKHILISAFVSICFLIFVELFQLFNAFSGVFDLFDILYEILAVLIAGIILLFFQGGT